MIKRIWVKGLCLAAVVNGCTSDVSLSRSTGESHFLAYCDSSCGDDLDCISGVCTRGCLVDENTCGDLAAEASCTDQSIEPGKVAVCDVECTEDADCEGVASGHRCDAGYCRGGDPPGGNGGGTNECSRGTLSYKRPDGSDRRCESCSCSELTACEAIDCDAGLPIYPCTTRDLEEVPEQYELDIYPHFDGDILELEFEAGGGCESHAISLCYDPAFRESAPVRTSLRLRHDLSGIQICTALFYEKVRFDLGPLRRYYEDRYLRSTGVIATNYGAYGFGELSCDQRRWVASDQVREAVESMDNRCTADEDCAAVETATSCTDGCQALVVSREVEGLEAEIERIDAAVCDSCESLPSVCAPAVPRCVEGLCTSE